MKLSSELQTKILRNPLNTILKSDDEDTPFIECKYSYNKKYDLPYTFSGKKVWDTYWTPVYNQGVCGSCYAFATTSMLADRFNIQSAGKYKVQLSPTKMILCGKEFQNPDSEETILTEITSSSKSNTILTENQIEIQKYACKGNTLYNALQYLYVFGVTEESCLPYTANLGVSGKEIKNLKESSTNDDLPLCTYITGEDTDMCLDKKTPERLYRAYGIYDVPGVPKENGSEETIKQEIYKWGPVVAAFKVYPNFYTFDPKKEVYKWDGQGEQVGGHAVEITGWGVTNDGTKYWEISNSWGEDWADEGFFKMLRGVNECELEENVYGVIPDFFYPKGYIIGNDLVNCVGKFINIRKTLDNNKDPNGEGIDPETGYSYRVMELYKGKMDFTRPVPLDEIPNRDDFVAGQLKSKNYQMAINNTKRWVSNNKNKLMIVGIIVLVILVGIVFFVLWKKMKGTTSINNSNLSYKDTINNPYYY